MAFDLADIVPLSVEIRDSANALANAGAIALTITLPDQSTVTPTPANPSTGKYTYDYATTQAGRHTARWVATGANASAFSDAFDVRESTPAYIVSLADAKAHLNMSTTDRDRDEELRRFIEGSTVIIEDKVGPVVVRSYTERHPSGDVLLLRKTPVVSLASVVPWLTSGTTYAVADLKVDTTTGIVERLNGGSFTGGPFGVTYKAGRTVIQANITQASLDLIRINFRSQQGGRSMFDEDGEFNRDYGMFVPVSVMSNLSSQQDYGIA